MKKRVQYSESLSVASPSDGYEVAIGGHNDEHEPSTKVCATNVRNTFSLGHSVFHDIKVALTFKGTYEKRLECYILGAC